MSKSRLTRQELSWLLTQEAQNAAERLRVGVQVLRTQTPPSPREPAVVVTDSGVAPPDPSLHVETSLDALDDVMRMLSSLNQRSAAAPSPPRRGRIDIATLLVECAPDARVSLEPGSGTEVFGEEADLRRMLQVLVGHGSGLGSNIVVRRDGDAVRVSVALGPDTSPTAETERVWLGRMAMRYGGRHELEGGNEVLVFPAEEAAEASEREQLRRELDEARRQGEVYARELAAMFERGEENRISTVPPPPAPSATEQFVLLARFARGLSSELRELLGPLSRELANVRRHDVTDEQLETLRRRLAHAQEVVHGVAAFGEAPAEALPTELDVVELARTVARDIAALVERGEVRVEIAKTDTPVHGRAAAVPARALVRTLLEHAVAASPRGGTVAVSADRSETGGARLVIDDGGAPVPASGRRAYVTLATDAGGYGRPSALPVFMAAELAAALGARLELGDAPLGGLRVVVTFPKS